MTSSLSAADQAKYVGKFNMSIVSLYLTEKW